MFKTVESLSFFFSLLEIMTRFLAVCINVRGDTVSFAYIYRTKMDSLHRPFTAVPSPLGHSPPPSNLCDTTKLLLQA